MGDYWMLAGLADYYLEGSWVLDIVARPGSVTFSVDVVLRESHSAYRAPRAGEQYCVRRGRLSFDSVTALEWKDQGAPPARDATGEIDYGSIDHLQIVTTKSRVVGDFGTMEISGPPPIITLDQVDL